MSDAVVLYLIAAAVWAGIFSLCAWEPMIAGIERRTSARLALLAPMWPLVVVWGCVRGFVTLVRWAR